MPSNNNNKKSPLSSSLTSNPNPRSSEINNPMRRSFTGNPFSKPSVIANPRTNFAHTPANSPSDFPRRSSVGVRESGGSLRDIVDDKENAKDQILKPAKVRSPAAAAASSKTTKNFMSPTISASFKIAESPRKKILSERNEPATTPTPSSDPKIQVRKVTFADPLEQKRLDASLDGNGIPFPSYEESSEVLSGETTLRDANVVPLIPKNDLSFETMNVPLIPKNDDADLSFETVHDDVNVPLIPVNDDIHTESSFETVTQEPDFVNLDPTFKLSPTATPLVSSKATVLAPLDADPLMPPYDPKTNYLSPRPQFLHYRPKPRMELCDQRELEDSFMPGTFSDTDVTEDTQSEGSQKESEDVSSDEIVKQEEDQISEPNFLPKKTVEAKEVPKPRLYVRSKAIALVLLLSVAFASISVTNSPAVDLTMFEDFYEAYKSSEFPAFARANLDQFSQFAKANFDGLARNLHIWFTKSLSSISKLISNVRGANNLAQLQYFNLTVLHDYMVVNQCPIFGGDKNEIGDTHPPVQESDVASEIGTYEYVEDISAEHYEVYEEQLEQDIGITTGVENAWDAPESEGVLKGQAAIMIESEQALQMAEVENLDAKLAQEVDATFNVEEATESEKVLEGQSATWIESEQALQLVEAGNSEENQTQKDDDNSNVEDEPSLNSEATEIHNEVCGEDNGAKLNVGKEGDADLKLWPGSDSEVAEIHTAIYDDEAVGESVSTDAEIRWNEQLLEAIQIPQGMVLYLLLFAGTVCIAGASFNWSRKAKRGSKKIGSSVEQRKIVEFPSDNNKQISPDKPSLRNGPVEMDVHGESCPSEMSSFENEKSSSYSRKVVNEANSVEKKRRSNHRRESLASSSDYSMGSPSYGSLTMYQKIPKGRGDEEIVTPVRRSSRIRSRATSPV